LKKKVATKLIESARRFVVSELPPRFHKKLLEGVSKLKLKELLKRKNPYLFRAKAVDIAGEFVTQLLDAYLSSKEETIFGDFLEALAIHICEAAFNGRKSTAEGIDLEFERDGTRYIVSIKSGPNWGNSQQIKRMQANFSQAQKIAGKAKLEAINGCCYGKESNQHRGTYRKLCGQDFWELVSGVDNFYQQIIEPLGVDAKSRTDTFEQKYAEVVNKFTIEFIAEFCTGTGAIDWDKLVEFNSGRIK
jgi:hypothetical protein